MLLPLLLATQAAPATAPAPPRDVVVVARSFADTQARLDACVARHCPTDEDVDAAIGHAQNQFVAGDYAAARLTLDAAIARNKGQARTYPVPVSDLWLVRSRVAAHMGETAQVRTSLIRSLAALKAGLPADDPRVLAQRIESADGAARAGNADPAIDAYRAVAADAKAAGQVRLQGFAMFKIALLYGVLAERDPIYAGSARRAIRTLADTDDPLLAPFRAAAGLLAVRLRIAGGQGPSIDDLVARYRGVRSVEPLLLYAPPIELPPTELPEESGSTTGKLVSQVSFADQWANVQLRIGADGRVAAVDVVGASATLAPAWLAPVIASIKARRYAPLDPQQLAHSAQRVERYTLTASWTVVTGSRLRTREARPRVVMLDITPQPAPGGDAPS